jgi:hypothetical protein
MTMQQQLEDFWNALGQFIYEFSQVERILFFYLITTSRMPIQDAKAVFTDVRIDKAKQAVKRLREARELPEDDQLDCAFSQLSVVTRLRNDLVHYGPTPKTSGTFEVSDDLWKLNNSRTYEISKDGIKNATVDLGVLKEFFLKHMLTELTPEVPLTKNMPKVVLLPWKYTPSQPTRPPSSTPSRPAKPPPQPVSSGE